MTLVALYCTFADATEAARIGQQCIDERLAACINILGPCRSIYRWQGALEDVEEVPAILKTSAAQADALIARIAALHSYDAPCIEVWPIDRAFGPYADWVADSVG